MTWVLIVLLAIGVFAALVWLLKLPRTGWEWAGAALLLGLAGYALQGSPGQPGAPKPPVETPGTADAALIAQRQAMGSAFGSGQSWLVVADGLSRQGQYGAAAQVLRTAVHQNPKDADLWVALGNALVGHGDGFISPAAQFAFQRAATISPTHPGPPFFMGLALAQSGRLAEARVIWARLLEQAPKEAGYRADLESRLARLDAMIGEQGAATPNTPAPSAAASGAPPQP
ncbi:tetratricopeptide repeat protein [Novosphingobium sp. Gsoil 351]|uniref:tetratricopeptide repeat protein n=1 Tax=Novosphingobium sp. Gsoil 351 TaxID=2675225 RepID=UPI0012B497E8|nr:tetratricopeptide repeat protein [Novosphingobium sp. Gsoil 351]QGN56043.1 tetratricopeptide repeat protein [Novosphingobium sp. Gsoil 351]